MVRPVYILLLFVAKHISFIGSILFVALNIVFGSLYLDEVTLDPKQVVSVLAAAALLQLDGLIEKCCEVMNATINAEVMILLISEIYDEEMKDFNPKFMFL